MNLIFRQNNCLHNTESELSGYFGQTKAAWGGISQPKILY